ncbi:RHS repeat-associated core domain-containing protein, partial [Luteimonas saliphila]|uniref:RHS repeat-associated core domain-containing protein n=1 Tax=Luteimonas saliphila TaxID=2804919 RepID=UPI003080C460
MDLAYSYDAAGNVTSMVDAPGIGTLDAQCFAYDGLRRLTEAWTPSVAACGDAPSSSTTLGGPGAYWNSYAFDELGNRTDVTERDAQGIAAEYAYTYDPAGGPHAVAAVDVTERLGGASTWSYEYDEAGNTTARPGPDGGAQSLAWDAEGKLEAVTGEAESAEFVYTADGDRVVRTEGGETTVYLPGGQEATVTTGGTVEATRFYSFAGATVAIRTEGGLGGVESLVTDHHGTVLARVHNTTRQLVKTLTDPYGNLRGGEAPPAGRGLMNKVVDESTGLTQVGARYYDQLLGRFISVDPVMDLTDPQQWHGYAYANNNPTTWDDPTGLLPPFNLIDGD